jgi:hypothetical protein
MVKNQVLLNSGTPQQLVYLANQFCSGAHPGTSRNGALYGKIQKGVTLEGANKKDYVLQLLKNLYGQKQAGFVWNKHLVQGLLKIGFICSKADDYKKSILLVYVDDSILLGPDQGELKFLIYKMSKCFDIQEEGDLCDYLGIQVKWHEDGSMTLTQP